MNVFLDCRLTFIKASLEPSQSTLDARCMQKRYYHIICLTERDLQNVRKPRCKGARRHHVQTGPRRACGTITLSA